MTSSSTSWRTIADLRDGYRHHDLDPVAVIAEAYRRLTAHDDPAMCLAIRPQAESIALAERLRGADRTLPLYGVPVAVKDNIDVAGLPTTAGCTAASRLPDTSAPAVAALERAGAIVIAKTNLDQFATGLVGTRSLVGTPRNPRHPSRIPGGSSSGSATIVAAGIVPLALGTDTAGSGRVPAAACDIVGIKPTCGLVSTAGVVPAVRPLDCVSIFALDVAEARLALGVISGFDPVDPYSRRAPVATPRPARLRVGIPDARWLEPCSGAVRVAHDRAVAAARDAGHTIATIDFAPFAEAAAALYGDAWVAERTLAVGDLVAAHPDAAHPVVAGIIGKGRALSAVDAYRAGQRMAGLKRRAEAAWEQADVLLLPTIPDLPTVAAALADPIAVNSALGTYTNFANLLDTCAVAVPPGITVFAPAWRDEVAADLAAQLHHRIGGGPAALPEPVAGIRLAVCGAHLRGQPLHHQLTGFGARFLAETRTAPVYRLFRLPTTPPKPGLVRVSDGGASIAVEVYALSAEAFGRFVANVPSPLAIGTVQLADGAAVHGFLCETVATTGAPDISASGGWREHLQAQA